jgi:hypothetical protein
VYKAGEAGNRPYLEMSSPVETDQAATPTPNGSRGPGLSGPPGGTVEAPAGPAKPPGGSLTLRLLNLGGHTARRLDMDV